MPRKVIIGVPFYRNRQLVDPLVESLHQTKIDPSKYQISFLFVVDSPDDAELIEVLETACNKLRLVFAVELQINEVNLGFVGSANTIFRKAIEKNEDVILLNSDVVVFEDTLQEMLDVASLDHMIGFVGPRTNDTTICTFPLPASGETEPSRLYLTYRRLSWRLPRVSYVPTAVGFCLFVSVKILHEFGGFDPIFGAGYNEENDLILRANRCGYRAVIANWAYAYHEGMVSFSESKAVLDAKNVAILSERYPEYIPTVHRYFDSAGYKALELVSRLGDTPKLNVAFDFSSFGLHANGTTEYGIKLVKHFSRLFDNTFIVHIICDEKVWTFHELSALPGTQRSAPDADQKFAAVVRLSQPFDYSSVARVAMRGAVTVFSMLDTIAYDCMHLEQPDLQQYWRFVMKFSDALIYISDFSRQQFLSRFPSLPGVEHTVSMPSTELIEYQPERQITAPPGDYVLILGNHFDHKWCRETVAQIRREAPELHLKVLGVKLEDCSEIESFVSGTLDYQTVEDLYACAAAVVYPSHYEGFGFPVLHALGNRKVVFLRDLPVYREIARRISDSSNLRLFETTRDLVAQLRAGDFTWRESIGHVPDVGWDRTARELREVLDRAIGSLTSSKVETRLLALEDLRGRISQMQGMELHQELIKRNEEYDKIADYAQRVQDELNRRDVQLAAQVAESQDWHQQLVRRNEAYAEIADYAQRVQDELNRRDVQLAAQVAESQDWHQQLVRRNEAYAEIADYAQRVQDELNRRDVQLAAQVAESQDLHRQLARRNDEYAALAGELRSVYLSSSWRFTGPLRGMASRNPGALTKFRAVSRRHPWLRRTAVWTIKLAFRAVSLRSLRDSRGSDQQVASHQRTNLDQGSPAVLMASRYPHPAIAQRFKPKAINPLAPPPAPPLARGGRRKLICFGHVLSYPPRAGNEYRIHRLLCWLSEQQWDIVVVVCPMPDEVISEQRLAEAAAIYPKLIVCDRDGTVWHNLTGDEEGFMDAMSPDIRQDIPSQLMEDALVDPALASVSQLQRAYCPDIFVDLIVRLQHTFRPELVLAEYVFMTRPFPLLDPGIVKAVDTHDVFSSKANKIERYGISESGGLSVSEETALLRPAGVVIAIQPDEASELVKLAPNAKIVSVGVDFPVSEPVRPARPSSNILLVGSDNKLNVKGLLDFLKFCWPLIRRDVPDAELVVVGAVGAAILDIPSNVRVTGRVGDLTNFYAEARVVINPAIAGTGLKIKTVEAICNLRPVVCWPSGVEGVAEEARACCHVASDWFTFARHVARILSDDAEVFAVERRRDELKLAFSAATIYAPLCEAFHAE